MDATQLEINPLVETDDGRVVAVDAKINFDDNAQFRQQEIFALDDTSETDPREVSLFLMKKLIDYGSSNYKKICDIKVYKDEKLTKLSIIVL